MVEVYGTLSLSTNRKPFQIQEDLVDEEFYTALEWLITHTELQQMAQLQVYDDLSITSDFTQPQNLPLIDIKIVLYII